MEKTIKKIFSSIWTIAVIIFALLFSLFWQGLAIYLAIIWSLAVMVILIISIFNKDIREDFLKVRIILPAFLILILFLLEYYL